MGIIDWIIMNIPLIANLVVIIGAAFAVYKFTKRFIKNEVDKKMKKVRTLSSYTETTLRLNIADSPEGPEKEKLKILLEQFLKNLERDEDV